MREINILPCKNIKDLIFNNLIKMFYFIKKVEESETDVSESVEEEAAEETDNETETEQVSHGNFIFLKYVYVFNLLHCKELWCFISNKILLFFVC